MWSPELEEHAALLLALRDHLEGVEAAVAAVAVPAAEGDQGAVEAIVPRAVLIHVPQAVLVSTRCKTTEWEKGKMRARLFLSGSISLDTNYYHCLYGLQKVHVASLLYNNNHAHLLV